MSASSRSYKTGLYRRLQNDAEARNYLQAAIDDSRAAFLVALRNVAEARNISKIARESSLNRVNVYRMLSESGNPTLDSLEKILHAFGLRIAIREEEPTKEKVANEIEWHTIWRVASKHKRINSYYAKVINADPVNVVDSEVSMEMDSRHSLSAAEEDPYFSRQYPVSMCNRDQEEICEMAY